MKISVFGQRANTDKGKVLVAFEQFIKANVSDYDFTYIHGGAKGPQEIVYDYVHNDQQIDCVIFRPWTMISKKLANEVMSSGTFDSIYFFFRNIQIVENSDMVCFIDDGTQDAEVFKVRELCEKRGVPHVTMYVSS